MKLAQEQCGYVNINVFKIFSLLYPASLKSARYYVIPSTQIFAFECPSVRLSVRQRFVSALYLEHCLSDFQTLYKS